MVIKQLKNLMMKEELSRQFKEGKIQKQTEENKEDNACKFVQRRIRGILARKHVERLREEEMEFLGMKRKVNNFMDDKDDPIKKMEQIRAERKLIQQNNMKKYQDAKIALKEEIDENEGTDIMETMLKDRREWVLEKR